jgi:hypothetical protein
MSLGLLLFIASASKLLSFIVTVGSSTFVGGVLIFYNAPLYVQKKKKKKKNIHTVPCCTLR